MRHTQMMNRPIGELLAIVVAIGLAILATVLVIVYVLTRGVEVRTGCHDVVTSCRLDTLPHDR